MPTFHPRVRSERLSGQIAIALYRIAQAIQIMVRRAGQAFGLSPAQVHALLFLAYARPGVRTIGGLAQRLQATLATVSEVVDALERKNLVAREPWPEDHRVIGLHLTATGRRRVADLEHLLDDLEAAIAELPADDQRHLHRILQHIVRRMAEAGHVVVYEMCWGCAFFRPNVHPENPAAPHHCAFMDAPLPDADTYTECPDFTPREEVSA
ncbi:MarR family winged helix-turn-helix transcriptional regulator [Thermoflexus sp.]|uniref:MarR family winged helix-turn-helix transcriptional regulator n=1 Tax=Thermoflexus sp. TaxID=1969742 RepID=UPI002ADD8CE4|nr:MarR family winged helix-turn-helix transcriptional regulator [Thermoflexus sp.]